MSITVEFYIPEKLRKKSMESFLKFFPAKCVKNIEKGIYDYTDQYCSTNSYYFCIASAIYTDHVRDLIFNLEQNHKTIKEVRNVISKGKEKFADYNLGFLTPIELDEDQWKAILIRRKATEEVLNNLPTIEWRPCYDCKCIQYSFYQLQTRSADEPMTTFYICKDCGRTYKINR
jgi:DNA-directed RNA polymerase subunit M/transcription elongation factor TFIIS